MSEGNNGARSRLTKSARKAVNKSAKLAFKAISFLVGALGGWVVLIVFATAIAALLLLSSMWDFLTNIQDSLTGSYTSESVNYKGANGELGLADAVSGVFYTRFAEQSYYIMIDDDPTIYQAGSKEFADLEASLGVKIEDIDNREGQFTLSPTLLMLLDQHLNDGYKNPEQFIKPVYNDCMSDLTGEANTKTSCNLLDLVDDEGNVVADSIYYKEREDIETADHSQAGEVERTYEEMVYNLHTGVYDLNPNATTKGVWNWGLGSIIHYKKFEQDSRISDYKINSVNVWDVESRSVITITGFSSNANREEYISTYGFVEPDEIITYETQNDEAAKNIDGLSLYVPETETKFAIDKVTSFVGNMSNALVQSYVFQGRAGGTSVINNYYYEYASSVGDTNTSGGERRAYAGGPAITTVSKKDDTTPYGTLIASFSPIAAGFNTAWFEKEEWETVTYPNPNYNEILCNSAHTSSSETDYCSQFIEERVLVHKDRYAFDYGDNISYIDAPENGITFTVRYNPQISYYKAGNLETNTVTYTNTNPDTEEIVGIEYLEDYINNYETYIALDSETVDGDAEFKCYSKMNNFTTTDEFGVITIDPNYTDKIASINYELSGGAVIQSVSNCSNTSFIEKTTPNGSMKKFYFDDMPILQLYKIAETLGISIEGGDGNQKGEIIEAYDIGVSLKNIKASALKKSQDRTLEIYNKYKEYFDDSATKYGIDVYLLAAIAHQETDGDHENNITGSQYSGFGLMQIEAPANKRKIKAYNFATRKDETLEINVKNMKDVQLNIQAAAMELQNLLVKYDYNALIAIQAYNYGQGGIEAVLKIYEEQTGIPREEAIKNVSDYGWSLYTKELYDNPTKYISDWKQDTYGDYEYLANILQKLPEKTLTFQSALNDSSKHSLKKVNIGEVYDAAAVEWSEAATNKAAVRRVYRKVSGNLENIWSMLTLNQKNYDAASYNDARASVGSNGLTSELSFKSNIQKNISGKLPIVADRILKANMAETDKRILIQKLFAYENGDNYHEYDVLDRNFWTAKYSSLFRSVNSKSWTSNIDIGAIFGGQISIPLDGYTESKSFGYVENLFGYRELNTVTEYTSAKGEEVKVVFDGIVTAVSNKETEDFGKYVEVLHSGESENVTITRYIFLGSADVKMNQEVKSGDVIGKVGKSGVIGAQLIVDGSYNDFGEIVRVSENYYKDQYLLLSTPGSSGPQNEVVTAYLNELVTIADEVEALMTPLDNWNLSSITDTSSGRRSAGTWAYDGTSIDHPALDWATPIGTDIYAPGDAVVLNILDNCVDYPSGTNYNSPQNAELLACNGKYGNKIVVVFKHTNGNIYAMTVLHAKNKSMISTLPNYVSGNASSFIISKGTVIAQSGHTGISTGPHEHIEIVNFGKLSLKEVIQLYLDTNYNSHFGIGYVPVYESRCESGSGAVPCKERPDRILKY